MALQRTEWVKLVGEWRRSRQSARQFAATHGVTDASLRYWAGRLAEEEDEQRGASERPSGHASRVSSSPTLARVLRPGTAAPVAGDGRVMVVLGKASILVEPGFDDAHLRAIVRALSEAG